MFKKLVKSALALALATAGSAFAMQKPTVQGKFTIGVTPAQQAAQKEQFAKMIKEAEAKKAAAKAKAAAAVTPTEKERMSKQVAEAERLSQILKQEQEDLDRAIAESLRSAKPAAAQIPAWPSSTKPTAPTLPVRPAAAPVRVWDPFTRTSRLAPAAEVEAWEEESSSSSSSSSPLSSPRSASEDVDF